MITSDSLSNKEYPCEFKMMTKYYGCSYMWNFYEKFFNFTFYLIIDSNRRIAILNSELLMV